MNDTYYEQIVSHKLNFKEQSLQIATMLLIAVVTFTGTLFLGMFGILLGALLLWVASMTILQKRHTEYEYSILNHELQIDAIYNRSKRKSMVTIDFQPAEVYGPNRQAELSHKSYTKHYDFTSGQGVYPTYTLLLRMDQALTRIDLEPDDTTRSMLRSWTGSRFYA